MRREESSPQKVNMPEYTLLYLNQGDVSYKDNDMENVIIGKILPLADVPSDLSTYELKPDEVKMLVTKYNKSTGQFLGIVKTIGQLIVRGDEGEVFFDYDYREENSKLLYSTRKLKIPNSFRGCMFTKHKTMLENGKLLPDFSRIYYYIPPTTDRIESINRLMGQVHLKPNDVEEGEFGEEFNPSILGEQDNPERKKC